MKTADANSAPTSATTSTTAPPAGPNTPADAAKDKAKAENESDFLQRQADEAKAALQKTIRNLANEISVVGDPRAWARKYPWPALGAAAVAGFAAAIACIPTREQTALNKLAEYERLTRPPAPSAAAPVNGDGAPAQPASAPMWKTILHEIVSLAKPAIISAISAQVAGKPKEESQPPADHAETRSTAK